MNYCKTTYRSVIDQADRNIIHSGEISVPHNSSNFPSMNINSLPFELLEQPISTFQFNDDPSFASFPSIQTRLNSNNNYENLENEGWMSKPPPPPPPPRIYLQQSYTPMFSRFTVSSIDMINGMSNLSITSGNADHSPRGVWWLSSNQWDSTYWDGIPFDLSNKSKSEICQFLGPSPYLVKGLYQKYYQTLPFADPVSPTVSEIENWHLIVIRHFRELFGISSPVTNDARLFIESRWSTERKRSIVWDSDYPDGVSVNGSEVFGRAPGPCWDPPGSDNPVDVASGHCGGGFFPSDPIHRFPYTTEYNPTEYPELSNHTSKWSLSEGLSTAKSNIPWSLKLAYIIRNFLCSEGPTGHSAPFLFRESFGCDWWWDGDTSTSSVTQFRGKWR